MAAPIKSIVRHTAAGALSGSARVLSVSSRLLDGMASVLRPQRGGKAGRARKGEDGGEAPTPTEEGPGPVPTDQVEGTAAGRGTVAEPPPTEPTVPTVPTRARTYDTHVEELAAKPAADIISAVDDLSTDELQRLYDHEQGNKNRKTVLAAIEQSLASGSASS